MSAYERGRIWSPLAVFSLAAVLVTMNILLIPHCMLRQAPIWCLECLSAAETKWLGMNTGYLRTEPRGLGTPCRVIQIQATRNMYT